MVVEATNPWTGVACAALGGVRVHFAPFQARPAVRKSAEPLEGTVTSPNGFPVRRVQRAHILRDPPCFLEKVVIAPLRWVGRQAK